MDNGETYAARVSVRRNDINTKRYATYVAECNNLSCLCLLYLDAKGIITCCGYCKFKFENKLYLQDVQELSLKGNCNVCHIISLFFILFVIIPSQSLVAMNAVIREKL